MNIKRLKMLAAGLALVVGLMLVGGLAMGAQSGLAAETTPPPGVEGIYRGESTAVRFSISQPVREMPLYAGEMVPYDGDSDLPSGLEGPLGPQDVDPLVQSIAGPLAMPAPSVSFDSVSNLASVSPPDPVGDVGPNHYVAMSNLYFAIYNKTGTLLSGPFANNTLWAGFGGDCETDNSGDPIVLYDQFADRWILTQFTASGPTYFNCVAISTTGDPTGSYYRWAFSTGSNFPDYPKYAVWSDAYYISTREFAGASYAGVGAYALNRDDMLSGDATPQVISFLVPPGGTPYNIGDGLLPADIDGSALPPAGSPNYFVGSMDNGGPYGAPQDALTLWKFTVNWAAPGSSSFVLANTIPVAAFDSMFPCTPTSRACIPQPGTANKLDILSYRQRPLWRLAYRNYGTHESLVTNQAVEATAGMAGIRWYELRSPNSSPVVYQQGTYAPGDGIHRWMGSIAMDASGNMALGYSASNGTAVYPSVWYTGRLASDTLDSMPQGEGSIFNGTGSQTGSNRWGDYTSMNIDPVDDCTFWYVNQYIPTTSSVGWRLRVGAFKFPTCEIQTQTDLSITKAGPALVEPGALLTYTLSVTNNGPDAITNTITLNNTSSIAIPSSGAAAPYPSTIDTSALSGVLLDVNVILSNVGHTWPDDVDVLLVGPGGETAMLMSDAGGSNDITLTPLTFDDDAAASLPDSALIVSGTYLPTDYEAGDVLPAPAPAGPYLTDLSVFEGASWQGVWSLYVFDDTGGDLGSIANGWSLELLFAADTVNISDTLPAGVTPLGYVGVGWDCTLSGNLVQCTSSVMPLGPAPDLILGMTAPMTTGYITNTAQVTTTVVDDNPLNDFSSVMTLVDTPPVAVGDVYTTTEDTVLTVAAPGVMANDLDVDMDPLTVALYAYPLNGVVTLAIDGSFIYTPTADYFGTDFFMYTLSDGYLTETAQVDLVITSVLDAPMVAAGDDQMVAEGDLVFFSGTFSDPGLRRLPLAGETFRWDFGDGFQSIGAPTASHAYEDNGTFTAMLTITDTDGLAGSDSLLVEVANVAPSLDALPDQQTLTAQMVYVNGVYADPGILDTHTVVIEWAPGITETLNLAAGGSTFSAGHAYFVPGTYLITVTITDDDGAMDIRNFEVIVNPRMVYLPTLLR